MIETAVYETTHYLIFEKRVNKTTSTHIPVVLMQLEYTILTVVVIIFIILPVVNVVVIAIAVVIITATTTVLIVVLSVTLTNQCLTVLRLLE